MRVLSKGMKDAAKRRTMNQLANGWDKLADRAEARGAAGKIATNTPNLIADVTSLGVPPKRERKSRLKCEMSEKPACNAMSQIWRSIESSAVRSVNACFSRSSVTC